MINQPSPESSSQDAEQGERSGFRKTIIVLFLLAACARAIDVWRPVDGTVRHAWRETDTAAIARNFYREDMNILLPRIDWRGDGPGYVESEFPLLPWTAACLYHVFGYHEEILRVLSYALSLGACLVFLRLARRLLPDAAIIPACLVFALSPMAIRMASAVQPEPLMFFAYLLAVDSFVRWIDHSPRRDYLIALLATTLAILAKVPAAHVGILFACLCLQKYGTGVFRRTDIWLFGLVSLGVPAAWYWHAHSLWLEYGNSLGISNEAYERISTGSFLTTLWETLPGVVAIESVYIWMGIGAFFGMSGLVAAWRDSRSRPLAYWFCALAAYFFVTGRTTGEPWAAYYHIVTTALGAMLIGLGFDVTRRKPIRLTVRFVTGVVTAAVVAFLAGELNAGMINPLSRIAMTVGIASGVAGLLAALDGRYAGDDASTERETGPMRQRLLLGGFSAVIAFQLVSVVRDFRPAENAGRYDNAMAFAPHVKDGELIVVGGASTVDQHGLLRASDNPYYFFWMDRKGFILHDDEQSIERLTEMRQRGARYFLAEKHHIGQIPDFEDDLRARFTVVKESGTSMLIDLGATERSSQAAVQTSQSAATSNKTAAS